MNITVAGTGYVGLTAGVCFAAVGHRVTCVDVDQEKVDRMKAGRSPIYEAGLEEMLQENYAAGRLDFTVDYQSAYQDAEAIFIGVGTPARPDGSTNLADIAAVARQIAESIRRDCLVVVKSTVPVGTNDKIEQLIRDFLVHPVQVEVASNPEFLAQGTAVRDTLHAKRIIIGADSKTAEAKLMEIYRPFRLPIVSVGRKSAEMLKYAANDFLALKISYMNEIANLCELVGADVEDVARGMSYDPRIGASFLNAGVGYGGSCFPKDTKALKFLARRHGYQLRTVEAAVAVNEAQKTVLFHKAAGRLMTFSGLKAAILGVTFKPGTDDLREAPALKNMELLLAQGAKLAVYDPAGLENLRRLYAASEARPVQYAATPQAALEGANLCFIFTEWPQIKAVPPAAYKKWMRIPLVYDGRNLYAPEAMRAAGVEYHSVGRSR